MDQPLGFMVGNALEVREALDCLRGGGPQDLRSVTLSLATEAVLAAEGGTGEDAAVERLEELLGSGAGLERFARLVERQGGDPRIVEDDSLLPTAPVRVDWVAPVDGYVARIDAYEIGLASVELGAGRVRTEDEVDPAVGIELCAKVADPVARGMPLAVVHARTQEDAAAAAARIARAFELSEGPVGEPPALVWKRVTKA